MTINISDLVQFLTVKKGLAFNSVRQVKIRVILFDNYLTDHKLALSNEAVEQFLMLKRSEGLKNNTLNTYVFAFRFLQFYFDDREIKIDLIKNIKSFPKNETRIIPLSPEEIEKIIATDSYTKGKYHGIPSTTLNKIHSLFIEFMSRTGCRFNELASLLIKDIDFANEKAFFITTKNKHIHQVFIPPSLVGKLKEIIEGRSPDDYVFINLNRHKMNNSDFAEVLKSRARRAGITKRVYPHLLRHSYGANLAENEVKLEHIAKLLNHKDIQTTYDHYAHFADKTLRMANNHFKLNLKEVTAQMKLKFGKEALAPIDYEQDPRFEVKMTENSLYVSIKQPEK